MHTDPTGNYTKINIHTTANIQQYSINATNVQTIHAKIIYKRSRMPKVYVAGKISLHDADILRYK